MKSDGQKQTRRGAVAPLMAILMIPLLGMCAYSFDVGYIILAQTDLQNAADSAALAGAQRLQDLYSNYYAPGQTDQSTILTTATTNVAPGGNAYAPYGSPMYTAEQYAHYNMAGGVYITVPDSDVNFGYTDSSGNVTYPTPTGYFPNTIQVKTRRDDVANTPLPLSFGPIFNKPTQSLTATATATIYTGDVTSLQSVTNFNPHVLPVALDVNIWEQFFKTKKSPDGTIHYGSNGIPQLHVYPTDTNTPGSFGLLDVGPPQNDVPAFRNWIDDGETPNDINYLLTNKLLPVSLDAPQQWKVGPGLKSTLVTNFASVIGDSNLIPLFVPVNVNATQSAAGWTSLNGQGSQYVAAASQGQNATYAIVGFAAVTVSQATGHGSNMDISIQTHSNIDITSWIPNPTPAGTTTSTFGTTSMAFISAKLTQ